MWTRRTTLKAAAALAATAPLQTLAQAQAPTPAPTPRTALKGYDPVAYFTVGTPTMGKPEFDALHDGVRYQFASAQNRDLFKADPDKYAPQFGGTCAYTMSLGQRRESDPTQWLIANGRLYVFAGPAGVENFRKDTQTASLRAAENWKTLKAPGN